MYRGHAKETTPMVHADYTGQIISYVAEKYAMTSKYKLAQSYMKRHLVMQNNIPSNLQANIEQVRPISDKYNTEYICNDLHSQQ